MLSIIFGIIGIVGGVLWLFMWGAWSQFLMVMQGAVPPILILVGLIAIAAGISSMKDLSGEEEDESGSE